MRPATHGIARGAGLLSRIAAWIAGGATLLCLTLVCVSVAARYFAGTPLPVLDRCAGWLVIAIVMLASPEAQRRFEHIGVDVLTGRLTGVARRASHLFGTLSVALIAFLLLQSGLETVAFSRMIGIMTEIEGVPVWWVQALLPVGAFLLMLVALSQAALLILGGEPDHLTDSTAELPRDTLARGE
ncbi:TRAP transporter small permease [Pseudoroseomonas globiformis]|uniref:TRAP transporter small permease protein n=1 Tax=Teichococcus globiformis TaxID=2307229 RepID=A0ABV7FWM0_9PROT